MQARGLLAPVGVSWAVGFAQFSPTVLLGEVAATFALAGSGASGLTAIGLTGTGLGVSFAVIRLSSLGGLAGGVLADRFGRRPVLLASVASGLVLTVGSAGAPGFVWWVALVASARPGLNAAQSVVGVLVAEGSSRTGRAWGMAWVLAAFAVGAGAVSVLHGAGLFASFRPIVATSALPLLLLPLLWRRIHEPGVYEDAVEGAGSKLRRQLGRVPRELRGRLMLACVVTGALGMVTAPVFSNVFVYGEHVLGREVGDIAGLVLAGGVAGGVGLLAGRWGADRLGRRATTVASLPVLGVAAIASFYGSFVGLVVGYLVALSASAAFGPAWGAWQAEAFPTSTRATAAAWTSVAGVLGAVAGLLGFGALIDLLGGFDLAIVPIAVAAAFGGLAAARLPETRNCPTYLEPAIHPEDTRFQEPRPWSAISQSAKRQ